MFASRFRMVALALGLAACAAVGLTAAPKPKVKRLVVNPSGATLSPGQTVQIEAVALDRDGNPMPSVPITYRSNASGVAAVSPTGLITGGNTRGLATVSVRAGSKSAKIPISVPAVSNPPVVAGNLQQINNILADDQFLFWTESDGKTARVRRMAKGGGGIYDLAVEPATSSRGVTVAYVQIQDLGDRICFSRQSVGFQEHWSLRIVAKAGGPITEILAEDIGIEPFFSNGWLVVGDKIVICLLRPDRLDLPNNVRVVVFDPDAQTWTPLLTGQFQPGQQHLLAAHGTTVYIRGTDQNDAVRILKIDRDGPANSFQEIYNRLGIDSQVRKAGAADDANVYFWSGRAEDPRLLSLPVTGGQTTTLIGNAQGSGLLSDGLHVYLARNGETLQRVPVGGGQVQTLQQRLLDTGVAAGLGSDAQTIYVPQVVKRTTANILAVSK